MNKYMKFVKINNLNIASALHSFTSGGMKLSVYLCECVYMCKAHKCIW